MADRLTILTWHSINVLDNTHAGNDLIAFSEDLELIDRLGWTMLPLAEALARLDAGTLPERAVVLTMDDGSIMDFHDFDHPTCGRQTSVFNRISKFAEALSGDSPHLPHVTSFVIASPGARDELDRVDYMSLGVWPEGWWAPANASGLMSVESHSWDHNHGSLAGTVQRDNRRGDFTFIDTEAECRAEVDQASDYIERVSGRRPRFFAYPYGQASDYLRGEYLPQYGPSLGLEAALGCVPEPVSPASDRWCLPRYVCGRDWKSTRDLEVLLTDTA
jgi:peptidoglycan/xylan/chitin deacetylase (PgdA/CDA1 family)